MYYNDTLSCSRICELGLDTGTGHRQWVGGHGVTVTQRDSSSLSMRPSGRAFSPVTRRGDVRGS